jgi:tetratricopeptide (TPR) repeat protein
MNNKLFIIIIFVSNIIFSQTKSDYASFLMKSRDYFRAISVYKELSFYSKDKDSTLFYLSEIGKAYQLSKKYESSILVYSDLLNKYELNIQMKSNCETRLGISFVELGFPHQGFPYFFDAEKNDTTGIAKLYVALCNVKVKNFDKANSIYKEINNKSYNSSVKDVSSKSLELLTYSDKISRKSSFVAVIFSSIIPGLGQIYCNHYFDGFQAFGFVSIFSFATYATYRYDNKFSSNYILTIAMASITSALHFSNILGAGKTASYYNLKQEDLFIKDIEKNYKFLNF